MKKILVIIMLTLMLFSCEKFKDVCGVWKYTVYYGLERNSSKILEEDTINKCFEENQLKNNEVIEISYYPDTSGNHQWLYDPITGKHVNCLYVYTLIQKSSK